MPILRFAEGGSEDINAIPDGETMAETPLQKAVAQKIAIMDGDGADHGNCT